jgi:hypothetical protein
MSGPGTNGTPTEDPTLNPRQAEAPGATTGEGSSPLVESHLARRRRTLRPVRGRTAAIVTAVVVVVGVGVVSSAVSVPPPAPPTPSQDGVQVAPVSALTSSLFCASGAGLAAGAGATGMVVLTNTSRATARGVMTTVAGSGAPMVRRAVAVPPLGTADVNPAQGLPAGATASTFTFEGGAVTGTMVVSGPAGWSTAPCASSVSSQWDFVGGSTTTGLLDLSLYNPTAAQSVVDVSFLTPDGNVLVPQAYQGITLAPGQLAVAGLGSYVQNVQVVATLVQTSSGAIVATELDQMSVPSGSGLALVAGTPGAATTWRFAQTTAVRGGTVTLSLANPSPSAVTALIAVGLSSATVTPKQVTVPGHTVVPFVASAAAGWPLGSPYSVTVTASAPVIVGRSVTAPPASAAPQAGLTGGTTTTATSWLVVGPGSPGSPIVPGTSMQTLAVANPGSSSVKVTVSQLAGGRPVGMAIVAANGLVVFGAAALVGLHPLVVTASEPVSVEVDDGPTGAPGVVAASGFPLGT